MKLIWTRPFVVRVDRTPNGVALLVRALRQNVNLDVTAWRAGDGFDPVDEQARLAGALAEWLSNDGHDVRAMDILDALASLGIELLENFDVNHASIAYMEEALRDSR